MYKFLVLTLFKIFTRYKRIDDFMKYENFELIKVVLINFRLWERSQLHSFSQIKKFSFKFCDLEN